VFGGFADIDATAGGMFRQDLWEWNAATGRWSDRTPVGDKPEPRAYAAMAYDADRGRVLLFGGRAQTGFAFEDTWEWNGAAGTWLDRTTAGPRPPARYLHAMGYDRKRKQVALVGGGAGTPTMDGRPAHALGDLWLLDPASGAWTGFNPGTAPGARSGTGLAWDAAREKLVLFGGLEKLDATATETPKQDVWEWDGGAGAWTERTMSGSKPTARYGFAMGYDVDRARVVVFGGSNISGPDPRDDTWEWDGATGTWTARAASPRPVGRVAATLVHDRGNRRTLLFGGWQPGGTDAEVPRLASSLDDLWSWDGAASTWTERTPDAGPRARDGHAMAYDATSGKVVLFGGHDGPTGEGFRDTWEWDGRWVRRRPAVAPPARRRHAMAWDPARGAVMLFAGAKVTTFSDLLDDVWEWNSAAGSWVEHHPPARPLPRWGHAMATDPVRRRVMVFGGHVFPEGADASFSQGARNDLWEWDGAGLTWTERTPAAGPPAPPATFGSAMVFDAARARLLLLGGRTTNLTMSPLSNLWEWSAGGGWQLRTATAAPDARAGISAAWDDARQRVVLFGGHAGSEPLTDRTATWEIDTVAARWIVQAPATSPPARVDSPLAAHGGRGVVLVFGGSSPTGPALGDTWQYTGPAIPAAPPDGGVAPDVAAMDVGDGPAPGPDLPIVTDPPPPEAGDGGDGPATDDMRDAGVVGGPDAGDTRDGNDAGDTADARPVEVRPDDGATDAEGPAPFDALALDTAMATDGGRGNGRAQGGGCGCRVGGAPGGAGPAGVLMAVGAAALVLRRRGRKQNRAE
jgi:MYXO-CTERM domain-containing protein